MVAVIVPPYLSYARPSWKPAGACPSARAHPRRRRHQLGTLGRRRRGRAAARAGLFRSLRTAVPAGLGLGVIASLTSTPISYLVFGCTTTSGIALATALGRALGLSPLGACFFGSFVSDLGDKAVTFALVTSVLHALPRHTAARFPWALRAIGAA